VTRPEDGESEEDGIPIFTITIRSRLVDGEEELDWKIDGRAAAYQAAGAVAWTLMEMHRDHIGESDA
jgi:hypothetical protein